MRTVTCFLLTCCFTSTTLALNINTDVTWFTFPGWDNTLVTGAGQTFDNVFGTVDTDVFVAGSLTLPTKIKGVTQNVVISAHATPGSNTFHFTLSAPLRLVINYQTVDTQELFIVESSGSMTNVQLNGAPAVVTFGPDTVQIQGSANGISPTGAARGYVRTSPVSSFNVTHVGLRNNKFESFRVGVPIPEPSGMGLIGLAILPFAIARRGFGC